MVTRSPLTGRYCTARRARIDALRRRGREVRAACREATRRLKVAQHHHARAPEWGWPEVR